MAGFGVEVHTESRYSAIEKNLIFDVQLSSRCLAVYARETLALTGDDRLL